MALVFLTIPDSDEERLRTVEWLGTNGITCYLRGREANATVAGAQYSGAVTILVPEEQLEDAQRFLAAMQAEDD